MPLIYQKFIKREDLRRNPQVLYVFGDNYKRYGDRGQAAEMRGEPNAIGVATKWRPTMSQADLFWDRDYDEIMDILATDLAPVVSALRSRNIVVWPLDGIGSGLSQLPGRAPRIWEALEEARLKLEEL